MLSYVRGSTPLERDLVDLAGEKRNCSPLSSRVALIGGLGLQSSRHILVVRKGSSRLATERKLHVLFPHQARLHRLQLHA
jgi:hypothetical protein